jgi:type VII secretion-associated serine protease mycosin
LRRLAAITASLATAITLTASVGIARAGTGGYTPGSNEWWLANWDVQHQVWPLTEGAGVTVAVVDSGVQASLPDLRGVLLPGGDTVGSGTNGEKDFDTAQDGHGTAVAVTIAGQGYGADGEVGIAPQSKILPVHAIEPVKNDPLAIANGIKYAVDHGASVINVSIGSPTSSATSCDPVDQDAVAYALAHESVVVVGSGDTNLGGPGPTDPASCAGVLAVGAVEPNGSLWRDSTQGPNVSVVAPGDHMIYVGLDGRYTTVGDGTSFSAPLVAGAAALIRSRYPQMPWQQVVQRLIGTAIPEGPSVPNDSYGYGIINVAKAVNASKYPVSASAPNPVYGRYAAWLQSTDGQAWAKANHVTVPGSAASAPSAAARPSSGSGTLILIIVIAAVVVIAAIILILVLVTRRRSGRGPRIPGAPGGYPPAGPTANPPQGQYPRQR